MRVEIDVANDDLADVSRLLNKVGEVRKLLGQAHDFADRLEGLGRRAVLAESRGAYHGYVADHPTPGERDWMFMQKLESALHTGAPLFSTDITPTAATFLQRAGLPTGRNAPLVELVGERVAEAVDRMWRGETLSSPPPAPSSNR